MRHDEMMDLIEKLRQKNLEWYRHIVALLRALVKE